MEINKNYCGDTIELLKQLPDNSIDLSITSPPYNKKLTGGDIIKKVKYDNYIDKVDEKVYQEQQIELLNEVYRVMKPGGSFFYNHKCRYEKGTMIHPIEWLIKSKWNIRQEITWNRKITGNLRGYRFWQIDERIYWLYKPDGKNKVGNELKSKHAKMSSIWEILPENKNPHPAPFPLEIPLKIIYSLFDDNIEGKLVLDTYMGSGTTAVACKLLGCNYIGFDISQNYLDKAEQRINNYLNEKDKLDMELERHIITGITYKERKEKKNKD